MTRSLRSLLPGLMLAICLAVPAHARDWLRAETPHFVIYSDGYPMELERWARKLEWFDTILRREIGARTSGPSGESLTIYLLEDSKAVQEVTGQKYLAGIYSPASDGPYLIANRKPGYRKEELSGQATLFHEYAHHFMYRNFAVSFPAWYREGFAEYVSTVAFDMDRHYTFGAPSYHRLKQLDQRDVGIETLLYSEVSEIEDRYRANFYAWSWLLTHYLRSHPQRRLQLDDYLSAIASGRPPRAAAQAFGDLAMLENELRRYAGSDLLYRRSREALGDTADVDAQQLDPAGSQLVELRLTRRVSGRTGAALIALEQMAKAHPANADVQYELAALLRKSAGSAPTADKIAAIDAALDRALAIDPVHAQANVAKAQLAMQRALTRGGTIDWLALRGRLETVLKAEPENAQVMAELFRSYLAQRVRPSARGYEAIEQAFALQPETGRIRTLYAISLGLRGQFAQARGVVQALLTDPHRSAQGTRALATLRRMEEAASVPTDAE